MNAQTIMAKVSEKYERCNSYTDCGTASWRKSDGSFNRCSFVTYIVRPRRLRFEWRLEADAGDLSTPGERVWCNGKTGFWRHSDGKTEKIKSLLAPSLSKPLGVDLAWFSAMCTASSECGGVLLRVAAIFADEKINKGKTVLRMKDIEILADEKVCDRSCYVLRGTLFRANDHILWISQSDFTLRRIKEESTVPGKDMAHIFERMRDEKWLPNKLFKAAGFTADEFLSDCAAMKHEDRHHLTEITYDDVAFDQEIAPEMFTDCD